MLLREILLVLRLDPLAVPSPSPINVTVSVPPDAVLDNYTLALAIFTGLLAVFTIGLAVVGFFALRLQQHEIKANEKQLQLAQGQLSATEGQLQAVRDQLRLAAADLDARRQATLPQLEVLLASYNAETSQAEVVYVGGTEPAFSRPRLAAIRSGTTTLHAPGRSTATSDDSRPFARAAQCVDPD